MQVYLDNSATTKPLPSVADAMLRALVDNFGNPSSGHSAGRKSRAELSLARARVADFVMTDPERIVFVSGATEANDAVLRSAFSSSWKKLITTEAEHPSTIGLYSRNPERIIHVPVEKTGEINLGRLGKAMQENPGALMAIGWVNGETGVIQPVQEICRQARLSDVVTLIDGAQALGRVPKQDFEFDYDFLSVSAHKMNGPKGIGCLILGEDAECPKLLAGGEQEAGRRSGTENLPGIVGFGAACAERSQTLETDLRTLEILRDKLEIELQGVIPKTQVNGSEARRIPTNTNITFPGVDGMALIARCDAAGVQFSQVSACSTGKPEPSKTLTAMALDERAAFSSVRLSLSVLTTEDEIRKAVRVISREAQVLYKMLGREV